VKNNGRVEAIGIRVVTLNFNYLLDVSPTRPAFQVNDDVHRIGDGGLDRAMGELCIALQNAMSETSERLGGGVGVNGRERPRVASVQELQELECLASTNLAQDNSIRSVPQGGFEKVANGDRFDAAQFSPCFQAHQVAVRQSNLSSVLDKQDAVVLRDERR
jgi:hypothetical protein